MYERCVIIMLMINIYLDESGNLGRGGDFFTIAGVVYDNKKGLNRLRRIVKKECLRLSGSSTPLDELKFHDLNFTDRQRILNRLTCRDDQCDSKSVYNLQVADIFAGAINGSYMRANNHMIDIIRPRIVTSIQFPHDAFRD